jgi:hypothetical protein
VLARRIVPYNSDKDRLSNNHGGDTGFMNTRPTVSDLGRSREAVAGLIFRGLKKLRSLLAEKGAQGT